MKRIGLMTSGGDAPGMNAAIRAVVRQANFLGLEVLAIRNGYDGLIAGQMDLISSEDVGNIIHRGGTVLRTSRSEAFREAKGREKAYQNLQKRGIEGLIIIGGNGTIQGAKRLGSEHPIPVLVIPKTIDNDVIETDYAIGFDTACNTVVEAIDKIRDTADAHHRLFFIEVMGRDHGYIALQAALATGAEAVLIPERAESQERLLEQLKKGWDRHKSSLIVIVAEGCVPHGLQALTQSVSNHFNHYEIKSSNLGYIQRGGSPSAFDRILACRLGSAAVMGLLEGKKNAVVGLRNNQICFSDFNQEIAVPSLSQDLYLVEALSTGSKSLDSIH